MWRLKVMEDAEYTARFKAGESFQRLSQQVNEQLLSQFLPRARNHTFQLAVVDALYPLLARELQLPSLHIVCASDRDFMSGAWFHYGFAAEEGRDVSRNGKFVMVWLLSWLWVGSHQDAVSSNSALSWGEYYRRYVAEVLIQGSPHFALPMQAAALARSNPRRLIFVGSLTARLGAELPAELPAALGADGDDAPAGLALVAFGTKPHPCPVELLRGLLQVGLRAVVLVPSCEDNAEVKADHFIPESRDQASWLRSGPSLRLAVVHGGIHSLHESVAASIPVACVPHEGDQWANCKDLQQQGLGWAVHPRAPAEEAAAAFGMLLDSWPEKLNRSALAAAAVAEAGGAAMVVRRVEQVASRLPPSGLGPLEELPPLEPFFAAPLAYAEGKLLAFPVALLALSTLCRCVQIAFDSPGKGRKTKAGGKALPGKAKAE